MKGNKLYRHKDNPKEKELHDKFINEFGRDMSMIVFSPKDGGIEPSEFLSSREEEIVISTIQWLGSHVGKSFLERCGFKEG